MRLVGIAGSTFAILVTALLIRCSLASKKAEPNEAVLALQEFSSQQSRQDRQNAVEYIKQLFQLLAGSASLLSTILVGIKAFAPKVAHPWPAFAALTAALLSLALGISCNFFMYRAKQEFGFYWEMRFHQNYEPWTSRLMEKGKRLQKWGVWCLIAGFIAFLIAAGFAMWFASTSLSLSSRSAKLLWITPVAHLSSTMCQLRPAPLWFTCKSA